MRIPHPLPAILVVALLPSAARAGIAMDVVCEGLPGCGSDPSNVIFENIVPLAIRLMIQAAAGLSVVFIVIAGVQMLLSNGDDGKVSTAKKMIIMSLGGLALSLTSASIVAWITTENYGQANPTDFFFGVGGLLQSVVRIILTVFNAGFVIMVILGGYRMARANGDQGEFKKGGAVIRWAIIGAVVVNLARAMVQALLQLNL